ncbi:MAG: hypothetical protein U9Q06_01205 [Nanoarchaeota archaeon]|nr:hypothetical protein [Nanoarchaeota archaeon]
MKRIILTGTLIASVLASCVTSNDYSTPLSWYIPLGEEIVSVNELNKDVDDDGKADFCYVTVQSKGEGNLIRRVEAIHKYNPDGNLETNPLAIAESVRKNHLDKLFFYFLSESYDCGTEKVRSKHDLPPIEEFRPDGIWDLESSLEIEIKPENK